MNILAELRNRFTSALQSIADDPATYAAMVKPSQDPKFGDFQANCAMPLANRTGGKSRDVAAQIVAKLDVADLCHPPEIAGPGFINLRLRDDWLEAATSRLTGDERLGVAAVDSPRTIVVDFSAPNVAKPMHVGHLRSSVLGDALSRILTFLGHRVIRDNHIGDWGTQFGMIIYGYKHFLDREAYERDPVAELARLYRLVNQLSDYHNLKAELPKLREQLGQQQSELKGLEIAADPKDKDAQKHLKKLRTEIGQLEEQVAAAERKTASVDSNVEMKSLADRHPDIAEYSRAETAKLHAGDEENFMLWEEFIPKCLEALSGMYRRMEIEFDVTLGESFYQPMLADVVRDLREKGIATESEGAICVFVEGNAAPFIIRKKDGAFTYATTDLATIRYRAETLQADEILYVVDARQSEHFSLLFATARNWGYDSIDYRHVSFGTILGEDKRPFKTRAGDTVGLESLLDEAVARARKIVDDNDDAKPDGPELDDKTRAAVAEVVGIGGIKYADLRHNRESDYVFSWDKMLATTGDTATYMQYAYARICGIFRKGGIDRNALSRQAAAVGLAEPAERALVLQLNRFPEAIDGVAADCRPNLLTQYLFETADSFMAFYDQCPVLKEPDEAKRSSRLLLCDLTARIIAAGLGLLGIQVCEQM